MSLDFSLDFRVFSSNVTHNLTEMADKVGIYRILWRPDEYGFETAGQIIPILQHGIDVLKRDPDKFKKMNPKNGWGSYDGLLAFAEGVLKACQEYPHATISVSI